MGHGNGVIEQNYATAKCWKDRFGNACEIMGSFAIRLDSLYRPQ